MTGGKSKSVASVARQSIADDGDDCPSHSRMKVRVSTVVRARDSTGATGAMAPVILRKRLFGTCNFYIFYYCRHPQWKNSINTQHP